MRQYSVDSDPDTTAKAFGFELHCSPKDCMNLSLSLKGMTVPKAKQYLEDVIILKQAVPTRVHKRKRAHKKGMGPGSYPKKAAQYMLKILQNAENNAEYKGFDTESMKIRHISAYQGRVIRGIMPRAHGRATDKNETTTNLEIILEEAEE